MLRKLNTKCLGAKIFLLSNQNLYDMSTIYNATKIGYFPATAAAEACLKVWRSLQSS